MAAKYGTIAAGTASAGQGGTERRGDGLGAKLAAGVVALGCAATLTLGGQPVGEAAGADTRATARPIMLAVDDRACIHASAAGIPGEGCGATRYTVVQVAAGELGCAYASYAGVLDVN